MFCTSKTGSRRLKNTALPTIFCQGQYRAPNDCSTSQIQTEHCYNHVPLGTFKRKDKDTFYSLQRTVMTNIFIIYHSGTIRTLEKYIYVPEIITFQRI